MTVLTKNNEILSDNHLVDQIRNVKIYIKIKKKSQYEIIIKQQLYFLMKMIYS